ncbi:MAG: protein kinase [Reyranella sp.]|uniref:protein kinase domain-containing protein n=1 Tax=Reyranella sp. TaxID=1929291 RepID=UPI003D127F62
MPYELRISIGQHSDKGRKETNQDFHGAVIPNEPALGLKGIAVALADGISSSEVSRIAAESAVKSFLTDYYCTSDSWSTKTSATRVIAATNSWLHAQTRRGRHGEDPDKGYVCTLAVLVAKSRTAHLFHIGDSRIYRKVGGSLEQLTEDHRVVISSAETYLGRALGVNPQVEIDYRAVELETGDVFVLATDGVYEHLDARAIARVIDEGADDLDAAAGQIVRRAFDQGSWDNLTIQIVRIDALPDGEANELLAESTGLPLPPLLEPRMEFDGYRIVRPLHASSRSHIYLATDSEDESLVALKIPSIDLRGDPAYLRRFMMEEWVARRLDNVHVLRSHRQSRKRGYLYLVTEHVDGTTLAQWMTDNPRPDLDTVRGIVEQIARGLQAFHRKEMLHQDLRPENVMIDRTGTAKIIDFGSTMVSGLAEAAPAAEANTVLGTFQYTAPEYFLGEGGTTRSDIFSLGVIAYQMIAGQLPYGAQMAQARTRAQQRKVAYRSIVDGGIMDNRHPVPVWVDGALRKAVHPDPAQRYGELSEFLYDLRHPNEDLVDSNPRPLIERNPLLFWKGLSFVLAAIVVLLLAQRYG